MTRGSLLGRDLSGTQYVSAWTARGAWSARCVEAEFRHRGPGTELAPDLLTDREQHCCWQQQYILPPSSAGLPQHSVMQTTAASVGQ